MRSIVQILKTTHPFSAVMATIVIGLFMVKLDQNFLTIIITTFVILLIQIITGMVNDYLDFRDDQLYQPDKPLVDSNVSHHTVRRTIIILALLTILITLWYFPPVIIGVIFLGGLVAQSYNLGMKNTPFSIVIFDLSFGLMITVPFILAEISLVDVSLVFYGSGVLIVSILHMANCLIDYEMDTKREANNFVVWLGRNASLLLITFLTVIISVLNLWSMYNIMIIGSSILALVILFVGMKTTNLRDESYYLTVSLYTIILLLLPIQ